MQIFLIKKMPAKMPDLSINIYGILHELYLDNRNSILKHSLSQYGRRNVQAFFLGKEAECTSTVLVFIHFFELYVCYILACVFSTMVMVGLSACASILTEPRNLTVDLINKYLEVKARGLI